MEEEFAGNFLTLPQEDKLAYIEEVVARVRVNKQTSTIANGFGLFQQPTKEGLASRKAFLRPFVYDIAEEVLSEQLFCPDELTLSAVVSGAEREIFKRFEVE